MGHNERVLAERDPNPPEDQEPPQEPEQPRPEELPAKCPADGIPWSEHRAFPTGLYYGVGAQRCRLPELCAGLGELSAKRGLELADLRLEATRLARMRVDVLAAADDFHARDESVKSLGLKPSPYFLEIEATLRKLL